VTIGSRVNPESDDLARWRASFRIRRRVVWSLTFVWLVSIGIVSGAPIRLEWLFVPWALMVVVGYFVWRCPRCGAGLGRDGFFERCSHCYLSLDPPSAAPPA
jgi:hypothetical protein